MCEQTTFRNARNGCNRGISKSGWIEQWNVPTGFLTPTRRATLLSDVLWTRCMSMNGWWTHVFFFLLWTGICHANGCRRLLVIIRGNTVLASSERCFSWPKLSRNFCLFFKTEPAVVRNCQSTLISHLEPIYLFMTIPFYFIHIKKEVGGSFPNCLLGGNKQAPFTQDAPAAFAPKFACMSFDVAFVFFFARCPVCTGPLYLSPQKYNRNDELLCGLDSPASWQNIALFSWTEGHSLLFYSTSSFWCTHFCAMYNWFIWIQFSNTIQRTPQQNQQFRK